MRNLQDLSQEQMGELLHRAGDAILAWPPPAPESSESPPRPRILRAAGLCYILTWAGAEYALPDLLGLRYLVALMEKSPTAIHVADLVDPGGQAKASLGQVYETDVTVDEKRGPSFKKALALASDADKAKIKTYLGGRRRRGKAGEGKLQGGVHHRLDLALEYIGKCSPGAAREIKGKLDTGMWCKYGK